MRTSQYYAAQILTQEWAQPVDDTHKLFTASTDVKDSEGNVLVTAYPLQRPDGQWSLMLINKDYDHPHSVKVVFNDAEKSSAFFAGTLDVITFGKTQYQWHADRKKGYANPDDPPAKSTLTGDEGTLFTLPPASLNVIRGKLKQAGGR